MVRGKSFGAIYLLNRERIERIPLEICDLIGGLSQFSIEQVKNQFENSLLVEQWIDYLWKNNIGHFTSEPTLFCDLPTEYHRPSFIHRAQIEISPKSSFDVASIAFQLDNLLCKHIEIRCVGLVRIETISSLISCFSRSCVRSIDLYVEKSSDIKKEVEAPVHRSRSATLPFPLCSKPRKRHISSTIGCLKRMASVLLYVRTFVNAAESS